MNKVNAQEDDWSLTLSFDKQNLFQMKFSICLRYFTNEMCTACISYNVKFHNFPDIDAPDREQGNDDLTIMANEGPQDAAVSVDDHW